ncbi:CRE-SRD-11 protein [Caenorhabditis remanei]|uniref:CRE-SRD-11 protein n=1 Tax=Caenorhabditis remanei TaxID=31234 RepID=E3M0A4_CAERE|nr:CRE-SRD-11 protein [Caenorhabditis remanei]
MLDPISLFFLSFHTFAAVVGCTLNAIVLFLALFRTPKTIAAYTTILINFALTDFLACFTDFFIQMRHIPAGFTMAYMSRGLCTLVGPHFCYLIYSVNISLVAHGLWSLLLGFSYRYYILFHPAPTRKMLIIALMIIYIPSFIQMWVFLLADDDPVEIKRILMERFPEYELENATVCGTINVIEFPAMYTILHMTCPITPVYITIWILRKKIIEKLVSNSKDMSSKTKEMHNQLLKALTWQALIPGFYGMSIASYVTAQFFFNHPIFEYTTLTGFLFMPVLSPLSCLIFIQIYRKRVLSWWYIIIGKPIPEEWISVLNTSKMGATTAAPSSVAPHSTETKSKH